MIPPHRVETSLVIRLSAAVSLLVLLVLPAVGETADRIVLRNLKIISDQNVAGMTVDGLTLSGGETIGWDEIESGRVPGNQELFDKYVNNLGIHLYRIRQRLGVGDYAGLLKHAEEISRFYAGRDSDTAYMVLQALMWGRLANGQREAAVEPYLYCLEYLRNHGQKTDLPGERRLAFDGKTGLSDELPPVWFDADAAKAAMPGTLAAIGKMKEPRPVAARIYYASLAFAAGETASGERVLAGLDESFPRTAQLKQILAAQQEVLAGKPNSAVAKVEAELDDMVPANKPLAYYWAGRAKAQSDDPQRKQEGVLELLHVPALFGSSQPELAAAALKLAMESLESSGDVRASIAVRKELLAKYGQSWHARQLLGEAEEKR